MYTVSFKALTELVRVGVKKGGNEFIDEMYNNETIIGGLKRMTGRRRRRGAGGKARFPIWKSGGFVALLSKDEQINNQKRGRMGVCSFYPPSACIPLPSPAPAF